MKRLIGTLVLSALLVGGGLALAETSQQPGNAPSKPVVIAKAGHKKMAKKATKKSSTSAKTTAVNAAPAAAPAGKP